MDVVISVLLALLIIVAILLIIKIVQILSNLNKTIKDVNQVVNDNKRNIDISILEVSKNLEETAKLLKTINMKERELRETFDNVDEISEGVANITTKIAKTADRSEELISNITIALKHFNDLNKVFKKDKNKGDVDE